MMKDINLVLIWEANPMATPILAVDAYAGPVNHALPLPAWAQVGRSLRSIILSIGEVGQKLPSETALTQVYGVSRITIRQALAQLVEEGYVARRQGSGTFIAHTKGFVEHDLRLAAPWRKRPEKYGHEAASIEVDKKTDVPVHLDLVQFVTEIELDQDFYWLKRLHTVDNMPIGIVESWVPVDIAKGLNDRPLIDGSLSRTMQERYNYYLTGAEALLTLADLTADEQETLETNSGDKAFQVVECFRLDGIMLALSRTLWNSSRVRFRI